MRRSGKGGGVKAAAGAVMKMQALSRGRRQRKGLFKQLAQDAMDGPSARLASSEALGDGEVKEDRLFELERENARLKAMLKEGTRSIATLEHALDDERMKARAAQKRVKELLHIGSSSKDGGGVITLVTGGGDAAAGAPLPDGVAAGGGVLVIGGGGSSAGGGGSIRDASLSSAAPGSLRSAQDSTASASTGLDGDSFLLNSVKLAPLADPPSTTSAPGASLEEPSTPGKARRGAVDAKPSLKQLSVDRSPRSSPGSSPQVSPASRWGRVKTLPSPSGRALKSPSAAAQRSLDEADMVKVLPTDTVPASRYKKVVAQLKSAQEAQKQLRLQLQEARSNLLKRGTLEATAKQQLKNSRQETSAMAAALQQAKDKLAAALRSNADLRAANREAGMEATIKDLEASQQKLRDDLALAQARHRRDQASRSWRIKWHQAALTGVCRKVVTEGMLSRFRGVAEDLIHTERVAKLEEQVLALQEKHAIKAAEVEVLAADLENHQALCDRLTVDLAAARDEVAAVPGLKAAAAAAEQARADTQAHLSTLQRILPYLFLAYCMAVASARQATKRRSRAFQRLQRTFDIVMEKNRVSKALAEEEANRAAHEAAQKQLETEARISDLLARQKRMAATADTQQDTIAKLAGKLERRNAAIAALQRNVDQAHAALLESTAEKADMETRYHDLLARLQVSEMRRLELESQFGTLASPDKRLDAALMSHTTKSFGEGSYRPSSPPVHGVVFSVDHMGTETPATTEPLLPSPVRGSIPDKASSPLSLAMKPERRARPMLSQPELTAFKPASSHLLLVFSDPFSPMMTLANDLNAAGFVTTRVHSVKAALSAVASNKSMPFHTIIVDYASGSADLMRSLPYPTPVIVTSKLPMPKWEAVCRQLGAADCLQLPTSVERALPSIRLAVASRPLPVAWSSPSSSPVPSPSRRVRTPAAANRLRKSPSGNQLSGSAHSPLAVTGARRLRLTGDRRPATSQGLTRA